jgi:hypothetical protein
MNRDPLLVRVLVAAYPASWRRQYGDEYAALLADTLGPAGWSRRPAIIANILRGVLDARLRSQGGAHMATRSPLPVAVWATGLFTVAGIGFQKLTEDQMPAGQHPLVGGAFDALLGSAALALAAVVVAALPAAVAMAKGRTRGALPLLAVPPLAFALWYGLLRVAFPIARDHPVHSVQNIAAATLVIGGGVAVVAATAWAAASVLGRVDAGPTRWQPTLMALLTLGMGVGTVACLSWGLAVRAADPGGFAARDGLLATPFLPSWILIIVLMAAATALAARTIGRPGPAVAG